MQRDSRVLLHDVRIATERVLRFTSGRSYLDYAEDELLRSAVERQLAIIGEALWRLRAIDPALAARFSELDRVVAFRHVLVHGYAAVDDRLVWGIVEGKLSTPAHEAIALLAERDGRGG